MLCCFYLFSFFSSQFHYYQLGSLMHNFSNSVSLAWRDLQTTVLRSFTRRADLSTSDFFLDMILKEFGVWFFIFLVHFLSSPSLCLWTHFVVTVIPVLNLKLPVLSSFQFHSVNDGHFVVSGGLYLYIFVPPFFDFLSVKHDYFFSAYLLKFV